MINVVMVAFNNPEQTLERWERHVKVPVRRISCDFPHEVTVVDNSEERSPLLADAFGDGYLWQGGRNLMYGPAINLAVRRIPSDFVLYVCTRHGRALDEFWVRDLLYPFRDRDVAQTGYLMGSNSPEGVAHFTGCPWVKEKFRFTDESGQGYVPQHIQGGVFMARTHLMQEHPYTDDIPHLYTDHILTWNLLKAGYRCVNVATILSVWRRKAGDHELRGIKYVHDEG